LKKTLQNITIILIIFTGITLPDKVLFAQNKKEKIINPVIPLNYKIPDSPIQSKGGKEKLAKSYYQSGQYEKAAELYKELIKEKKRYSIYYYYYFKSLVKLKKYDEAEKLCKKLLKENPKNVKYKVDLAYIYKLKGEDKKSEKIINKILTNLPDNKNMVITTASNFIIKGFYDQALAVYKIAKEKNLGNYDYLMELSIAYRYVGDYDKMMDVLLEYLDNNPSVIDRVEINIQSIIAKDVDNELTTLIRNKILAKAQKDPSNPAYAELLMWYSLQTKDFELALRQAKSIERRFADQEVKLLDVYDVAFSNGKYEIAAEACKYLIDKKKKDNLYYPEAYEGYFKARYKLNIENNVNDKKKWEELVSIGEKALEELGYNNTTEIIKDLAQIKAFKLGQINEALSLLNKGLNHIVFIKDKCILKMEKADILAYSGKFWDASLLYAQIEDEMKNEPLGHEAKFRNARLFYFKGEFTWAKTRLDVLKGSTSKLIANDALELSLFIKEMLEVDTLGFALRLFAAADQNIYQQKYDTALIYLSKIEKQYALPLYRENVLYKKANIYEKLNEYKTADSLYTKLYSYYPESVKADNAIFKSAEINRLYFNNTEKAKELYLQLMKEYPESIYATEARKLYRQFSKEQNTTGNSRV
jgi:tetratricopeptide (TPR) repeat protein